MLRHVLYLFWHNAVLPQQNPGTWTGMVTGVYGHAFRSNCQQLAEDMEEHFFHPDRSSAESREKVARLAAILGESRSFSGAASQIRRLQLFQLAFYGAGFGLNLIAHFHLFPDLADLTVEGRQLFVAVCFLGCESLS